MRSRHPGFGVVSACHLMVIWEGALRPFMKYYSVQILYSLVSLDVAGIIRRTPHVEVVQPLLHGQPGSGDIPHIFRNRQNPERPRLCLYLGTEWTPDMAIAATIVPWTVEWLACYEGWLATNQWTGGGHGTERMPG